MTDEDISKALDLIDGASKGEKQWGIWPGTGNGVGADNPVARFAENYHNGPAGDVNVVVMRRDAETPIEVHAITLAITGNGPTSEANAMYIIGSFDPVTGWEAALREVRRLRRHNTELLQGMRLRKA